MSGHNTDHRGVGSRCAELAGDGASGDSEPVDGLLVERPLRAGDDQADRSGGVRPDCPASGAGPRWFEQRGGHSTFTEDGLLVLVGDTLHAH